MNAEEYKILEKLSNDVRVLRAALLDFLASEDTEESFAAMELGLKICPASNEDKISAMNAINALRQSR